MDDKLFEQEEQWLDECQNFLLKIDIEEKCYVETVSGKSNENPDKNEQQSSGMIGMQSADSESNMIPLVNDETQPSVSNESNHVNESPPAEISDESVTPQL